jgi:hypothetical protein
MHNQQYSTDQPMYQLQSYDPNNPPHVPNVRPMAEWIAPYVRYMTGLMMDMITREAQGPISMHFYNHMIDNAWRNQDFDREVANCADFIAVQTSNMHPQQIDPNQVFIQLVPVYLNLRTMFELKLFPGLWQFVDPNDRYGIEQTIQKFEREVTMIMQFRGGDQPNRAAVVPGANMAANRYPTPAGNAYQPAPVAAASNGGYGAPVGGSRPGGGRDYGNTAAVAAAPVHHQPAPMAQPVPTQTKGATAMPVNQSGAIVDVDSVKWNPSEKMHYPMAYNPVVIKMAYKIEDGKTIPFPIKTDLNMIDFDRHNISTLFGLPQGGMDIIRDNSELMAEVTQGVRDAKEEENAVDNDGKRLEHHMALPAVLIANTLEGAVQDVRTEMLAAVDKENVPMVFQAYAQVYSPIIGTKSEYTLVNKLANASTFIALREELKANGSSASPELLSEIALRLTDLMNSILHKNLSILPSEITVDDFANDLDQLLGLLKTNYSDKMQRAFLKDQATRIKALFGTPDMSQDSGKHIHDLMVSNLLTQSWEGRDDTPEFTFFGSTVRFSMLNILSHDLQVAGMSKVGNMLTKAHTPALYELACSVFSSDNNGQLVARQLVVTKDGRILELTEANLVDGGYLVSLVK